MCLKSKNVFTKLYEKLLTQISSSHTLRNNITLTEISLK